MLLLSFAWSAACSSSSQVSVNWHNRTFTSRTTTTLQMVMHPLLTRDSPIHDAAFRSLAALNTTRARFSSWFPFPHLSVPALDPPSGLHQCRDVSVGYQAELSCARGGGVIDAVEFASFGLPDGVCAAFQVNAACHAPNSSAVVSQLCLGKKTCTVPASTASFGSPCPDSAAAYRLAVQVSCNPPQNNTYWDFSHLGPVIADFLASTRADTANVNLCTAPSWLYDQSGQPVHHYPDLPWGTDWGYETGTQLLDPSCRGIGEWYGRVASWLVRGGFTDEYGLHHSGGPRLPIRMWEVLNEVLHEHATGIEEYICIYDAVVTAVRAMADPEHRIEFVGLAYANIDVEFYEDFATFLNHSNHQPDIPLDWISYHWYSEPASRTDVTVFETFFPDNDHFLTVVRRIESLRLQLSPETRTTIDEIGVVLPGDNDGDAPMFPLLYHNAAGAAFAHLFALLSSVGIDVMGSSQLMGNPTLPDVMGGLPPQFPSVSILNWTTGEGTARYWTLSLLIQHFQPGDHLMQTTVTAAAAAEAAPIFAQAFQSGETAGTQRILLINTKAVSNDAVMSREQQEPSCGRWTSRPEDSRLGTRSSAQTR